MFTTNKKFFDKKNIMKNQDANTKFAHQKSDLPKKVPLEQYGTKDQDTIFSMPYESEDEYIGLANQFRNAKFDIGYQSFEKAFPFKPKEMNFKQIQWEQNDNFSSRFDIDKIQQQSVFYSFEAVYEQKQEAITQFERESSDDEESLDEESTKDNSNNLKEEND